MLTRVIALGFEKSKSDRSLQNMKDMSQGSGKYVTVSIFSQLRIFVTVLLKQVKLLLQLADTLVEKGHAHAPNIKQWVEEVKVRTNHINMTISKLDDINFLKSKLDTGGRYLQELFNSYGQVSRKGKSTNICFQSNLVKKMILLLLVGFKFYS